MRLLPRRVRPERLRKHSRAQLSRRIKIRNLLREVVTIFATSRQPKTDTTPVRFNSPSLVRPLPEVHTRRMHRVPDHDAPARVPLLRLELGAVVDAVLDEPLRRGDHPQHDGVPVLGLQHLGHLLLLGGALLVAEEAPGGFLLGVVRECQRPGRLVVGDGVADDVAELAVPVPRAGGVAECFGRGGNARSLSCG